MALGARTFESLGTSEEGDVGQEKLESIFAGNQQST